MRSVQLGTEAAAEAVEAPDDQRAAIAMRSASLGPSWAVGGKAANVVLEHALATSLGKGIALHLELVFSGTDAGVADDHVWPSENPRS